MSEASRRHAAAQRMVDDVRKSWDRALYLSSRNAWAGVYRMALRELKASREALYQENLRGRQDPVQALRRAA